MTMLAAIHCLDVPGQPGLRDKHYDAHRAYLKSQTDVYLVMTGPLLDDAGDTRIGSLLIVQADDLETVRRFSDNDPFHTNGVFGEVRINPFIIANSNSVQST